MTNLSVSSWAPLSVRHLGCKCTPSAQDVGTGEGFGGAVSERRFVGLPSDERAFTAGDDPSREERRDRKPEEPSVLRPLRSHPVTLPAASFVVGIDNGATSNNATVLEDSGRFLVDQMVESPSRVKEGTEAALDALQESFDRILALTGIERARVRAIGLDSPGPASAEGVIFRRGSTNFGHPSWNGFDLRAHLERRLGLPVVYNNDGNAAALYAHARHFGVHGRSRVIGLRHRGHGTRRWHRASGSCRQGGHGRGR